MSVEFVILLLAQDENVKEVSSWLFRTLSIYQILLKKLWILFYIKSGVFEVYIELIHIEHNHTKHLN